MNTKYRKIILLIIVTVIIFLSIPWPGIFLNLQITQVNNKKELVNLPFILHHSFSISYINSIYLTPVVEKYEIEGTLIVLREINTKSWGVVEYYNIIDADIIKKENGEICICDLNYIQSHILMITGYVGKQKVTIGKQIYSLSSLAGDGEKIKIESIPISAFQYLQKMLQLHLL